MKTILSKTQLNQQKRRDRALKFLRNKITGKDVTKRRYDNMPRIGHVYYFRYLAKGRKDLPYWDASPVIICVNRLRDGFQGLNMHYLPPRIRNYLFSVLDNYTVGATTETKRMQISYNILKNASGAKAFQPCFKRYLYPYCRSKFEHIPHESWEDVIMMPLANWQGASQGTVYAHSKKRLT